jgi:hypothetical protein
MIPAMAYRVRSCRPEVDRHQKQGIVPIQILGRAHEPMIGPVYFPLKPGEYIQELLASIDHHKRVCVVTVPAPAEYADSWPEWPRIVSC